VAFHGSDRTIRLSFVAVVFDTRRSRAVLYSEPLMKYPQRASSSSLSLALFSLLEAFACDSLPDNAGQTAGGAAGGAWANQGGGGVPSKGTSAAVCNGEESVAAPTVSADCKVAVRSIDPSLTCASADCPITKALDVTCASQPDAPSISATADGAIVLTRATNSQTYQTLARLLTVDATDSRVQDVAELALPYYSLVSSAASASSDGAQWLFAGETPGITAVHKTAAGWTREPVVSAPNTNETSVLTDARLFIDSKQGYL
jgi:hypothetical protein